MMEPYRVFLAKEILTQLRDLRRHERVIITGFFDEIADDPFRAGDFEEQDDIGRDIQLAVIGRYALYFWSDRAVKVVKVIGIKVAGS